MDVTFLMDYLSPIVVGICLMVGFTIKIAVPAIPNRLIPLIAMLCGLFLSIIINLPSVDVEIILKGMFSGLASTGLYVMLRNLLYPNSSEGG